MWVVNKSTISFAVITCWLKMYDRTCREWWIGSIWWWEDRERGMRCIRWKNANMGTVYANWNFSHSSVPLSHIICTYIHCWEIPEEIWSCGILNSFKVCVGGGRLRRFGSGDTRNKAEIYTDIFSLSRPSRLRAFREILKAFYCFAFL